MQTVLGVLELLYPVHMSLLFWKSDAFLLTIVTLGRALHSMSRKAQSELCQFVTGYIDIHNTTPSLIRGGPYVGSVLVPAGA
jgi:hypothetical protein